MNGLYMNTEGENGYATMNRSVMGLGTGGGGLRRKWKRKHAKLLVSAASVSCYGFQLACLVVAGLLSIGPNEYKGAFVYLIAVSAALAISTTSVAIVNHVGGSWAKYQLLFELCWIAVTTSLNFATLLVVVLQQGKHGCGSLFQGDVGICKINSLSIIVQAFGMAFNIIQAAFLCVIIRQARALTKQSVKTILLTPTSELHELVPNQTTTNTMTQVNPLSPYTQTRLLSPVPAPEDVETGRFVQTHRSKSSSYSSRYHSISASASEGHRTVPVAESVRSATSFRVPPPSISLSTRPDIFTQPPPPVRAGARREVRRASASHAF